MRMMDAIVKPSAAPGLELRQVPVPTPGPGEVLIKIHKTAICGTDVNIYDWNEWSTQHIKPPMVIGDEYVGEIAELGAGVTGFTVGQRVSGEGHITCGHCRNCHNGNIQWCKDTNSVGVDRDGAFAEYVCIPATNVIAIDPSMDEDVVAMFDAVGNATHTALMFDLVGEDVLITGAGPIGIIAVAICKYAGARRVIITDIQDARLEIVLPGQLGNRPKHIVLQFLYAGFKHPHDDSLFPKRGIISLIFSQSYHTRWTHILSIRNPSLCLQDFAVPFRKRAGLYRAVLYPAPALRTPACPPAYLGVRN